MEKHIKSGSLHQWAKEKFCRPEQSNEIDRNQSTVRKQSTLERCVAGSVRKNYTQLFNTALSLVLGEKPLSDFPFAITLQKRNGVKFAPGKDDEHSCAIFIHFLAEAVRNDIKSILKLAIFFAGEMDGSEARKTHRGKGTCFLQSGHSRTAG